MSSYSSMTNGQFADLLGEASQHARGELAELLAEASARTRQLGELTTGLVRACRKP